MLCTPLGLSGTVTSARVKGAPPVTDKSGSRLIRERIKMAYMEWNPEYATGVDQIDEHHKHLVKLLNTAYEALTGNSRRERTMAIVDELVEYATYHFATEELLMGTFPEPEKEHHVNEHRAFSRRVVEFRDHMARGEAAMTTTVLAFLGDWLTHHILHVDKKLGRYLAASGIS